MGVMDILLILVVILIGIQLFLSVNSEKQLEERMRNVLLAHEYEQVGGKENYEIITKLQKLMLTDPSNPQNIEAMKEYLAEAGESTGSSLGDSTGSTAPTAKTLTEAQIDGVLTGAVVEGNKDADIVAVEYSDLECPFCIMQSNENKIHENITAKYADQVAFVFKNNRGVNHAGTEEKALGLFCARKLGGDEAYVKFYSEIMSGSTTQTVYPVAEIPAFVKSLGLDVDAWQSCVNDKEFLAAFNAETAEAKNFGLSGTPGTLIFNKKTGAYTTVSGAQPFTAFSAAIDSLME